MYAIVRAKRAQNTEARDLCTPYLPEKSGILYGAATCSLWPSTSRVSEGKVLPYLACYHIWHVTIYGMLTYLACYHIWHVTIYGMLKYLACYHIWYFTIY